MGNASKSVSTKIIGWKRWVPVLLLILCFGAYFNSVFGTFVFDDLNLVKTDDRIEKLENIPRLLNPFSTSYLTYRPIRTISYAVDHYFSQKNPVGYHISNIFYHFFCCWLVFLLARKLSNSFSAAVLASLLFALHPVHTEAVSYISGRRDVLSTLFFLLGFYWFLRYREEDRSSYLAGVFFAYILGVLTKEMAVTLPAVMFLYDWKRELDGPVPSAASVGRSPRWMAAFLAVFRKSFWLYVPAMALGFFVVGYYLYITPSSTNLEIYWGGSPYLTFLTTNKILVKYLLLLLFPWTLIADYNSGQVFPLAQSITEPGVLFSLAIVITLLVFSIRWFAKSSLYGFAGLFFFLTILPVCHIIPHHELMSEHFLYLPSFAFCLALAVLLDRYLSVVSLRKWAMAGIAAILLFYAVRTVVRNQDWKDEYTLWSATRRDAPSSIRAHTNLGLVYLQRRDYDRAIDSFRQSLQIPSKKELGTISQERAWQNLGVAYHSKGDWRQAMECYQKVIELNPLNFVAYLNIAAIEAMQRKFDEAIAHTKKALAISPSSKEAMLQLAKCYATKKDFPQALAAYEQLIQADRGTDLTARAHYNMGIIYYYQLNDYPRASHHFEIARRMNPTKYPTEKWLGKPNENVTRIETPVKKQ